MIELALAAVAGRSCLPPRGTDQWVGSQVQAYAQRSVEIIALAAKGDVQTLNTLVAPDATFALGSSDVGQPLGNGIEGARSMAAQLKAASYVYNGWDYIPEQRQVCGKQDVEVEFVTADGSQSARVKFHYDGGVLRSASGWWRSRFVGSVEAH